MINDIYSFKMLLPPRLLLLLQLVRLIVIILIIIIRLLLDSMTTVCVQRWQLTDVSLSIAGADTRQQIG